MAGLKCILPQKLQYGNVAFVIRGADYRISQFDYLKVCAEDRRPKQKGDLPVGISPSACRVVKVWFSRQTTTCVPEDADRGSASCGSFELGSSFPHFSDIASVMRVSSQPFASFVADSLEGHLSTLSFSGKNFLPLLH